jgi:hypothetical protein
MAIIECSECKGQVSDKAIACPHCGNPTATSQIPTDKQGISPTRIEEMMKKLAEGDILLSFSNPDERAALIKIIAEKRDANLAQRMLFAFGREDASEDKITAVEVRQLTEIIIESKDSDIACSALIDLSGIFTEREKDALRDFAVMTKDARFAYWYYREDCFYLSKHAAARAALRRTVINTDDPEAAVLFLKEALDNLAAEAHLDLKSLAFTPSDFQRFKNIIISNKNPKWAYDLLWAGEKKPVPDEYDEFSDPFEIPVELTTNERSVLKRKIIESRDPDYSYTALRSLSNLSKEERMAFKGNMMFTKKPYLACYILCDADIASTLNEQERAYLRPLAAEVKDSYDAGNALEKIFDLTPEERVMLERTHQAHT